MATQTSNYNLVKQEQDEFYNVDIPNGNMDIIDAQLKANADDAAAKIPKSLATAADQVPVSSGVGAWAVKTLAQFKTWLGLGAAAYAAIVNNLTTTATGSVLDASQGKALSDLISTHTANISNPHSITASQVGLGNVNNTSDVSKPISTATQTALNAKAPLVSPAFTGTTPTADGNMMYHAGNITISTAAPVSALAEGAQHQVY